MYTAVQGVLMLASLLAEWATEQLISWPLGSGQPKWHCFRCIQSTCRCAIKQWQKMLTFNKVLPSSDGLGCYIYMAHAARTRLNIFLLPRPKERWTCLGRHLCSRIWGLAQPASQLQIVHKAMHRHVTYNLPAA